MFLCAPAIEERVGAVAKIREGIEIVHTAAYGNFLKAIVPPFIEVLRQTEPQIDKVKLWTQDLLFPCIQTSARPI